MEGDAGTDQTDPMTKTRKILRQPLGRASACPQEAKATHLSALARQ